MERGRQPGEWERWGEGSMEIDSGERGGDRKIRIWREGYREREGERERGREGERGRYGERGREGAME